ncbi:MAG TPA: prolyl oligopeptidase family serine peptidase [Burkholderiales bacterium]|nr:prolyl oligopeptidase family serine peptidase [Burkholderiales bacterium]
MHTLAIAALALAAGSAFAQPIQYPATAKKAVTDAYQGTQVTEDYRWLEDGKDPAVRQWSLKQLEVTRAYLDALPQRLALKERLAALLNTSPVRYFDFQQTSGGFFALKRQPPKNQPMLVVMKTAGDVAGERVLLDPNVVNAKSSTAIDFYEPSLDGRYVAVSLSENGSEDGSAHVIEVASGKRLDDVVPRVAYPTGGGSFAWDAKSTGFYYTRYPQGNERPKEDANFYQQVRFHKLGTPAKADKYVIGKEFPRIAETVLSSTRDGRHVLAAVANGDGGDHAFYLRGPAGKWSKVADFADNVRSMTLGFDGRLFALVKGGTPRGRVIAMPLDNPKLAAAKVVVAQSDDVIQAIAPTTTRLYVVYLAGGPSEIRMLDFKTGAVTKLPADPVSSNFIGARLDGDDILAGSSSYLQPLAWYRFSPGGPSGQLDRTALAAPSKVSFTDAEVVREMATSKDGTKVPVNIIIKKGTKLDGSNPVLLTGYGGYGISLSPYFSESRRVWLDGGGIFAVANLRGGGEFGEAWHLAGNLTKKQNVFDDMIAAAEHLVSRGYTKPERLAAIGGSNGGLLMGAILVQRPELFRAIVSSVGIYDMLRVELTPNGAFNVTEFGTVKDPAQFKALYAYSPYHHVEDGTAYPAVLLASGENDGRVDPYNSRKMAARLQAASPSGRPVLLRMSMDTGHGMGTPLKARVEEEADTYAFLMAQLGMVLP